MTLVKFVIVWGSELFWTIFPIKTSRASSRLLCKEVILLRRSQDTAKTGRFITNRRILSLIIAIPGQRSSSC